MATSSLPLNGTDASTAASQSTLLVCIPEMSSEGQRDAVLHLAEGFQGEHLDVAGSPTGSEAQGLHPVEYTSPRSSMGWVLAGADYAAAATLMQKHSYEVCLLLGSDASTLPASVMRGMIDAVRHGADLVVPKYPVGVHDALVTSSLLYPMTRSLFGTDIRFPLPVDTALSPRMLQRLASVSSRTPSAPGTDAIIWSVSEAAVAGFRTQQVDSPERRLPPPPDMDLNSLLGAVVGSLFADIEAKASAWQRARAPLQRTPLNIASNNTDRSDSSQEELRVMIENFRLASANLGEIWSLVIPPQSLLAIKKLAAASPVTFRFDPSLWARTVYDFALAFHGRSLNRGHLLGAMTPLYLAWVASYLAVASDSSTVADQWIELNAQAFEREKPYLVSRWRWPDRFNP